MISRICLGTVQFGLNYGIANKKGHISKDEAFKILDYAKSIGIHFLDTAFSYGSSEAIIGEYLRENSNCFKIVSKLPSFEQYQGRNIGELCQLSLQSLGVENLHGCLFHKFEDVLTDDTILEGLKNLKKQGVFKKIGFSLYLPKELDILFDKGVDFDMVQVPYSIFDQRFETYFDILKEKNIEIQVRSIFLQGLAFLSLDDLSNNFKEARPSLECLQRISEDEQISIEALCLNFVLANAHIDKVLFGVDSLAHFKRNIEGLGFMENVQNNYKKLKELKIEHEYILLPYKWSSN